MIKIKHDEYYAKEIIMDEYDNFIFEINFTGGSITFRSDLEYDFNYLTTEEKDTIINYLIGVSIRYGYNYNAFEVFQGLCRAKYQQY